MLATVHHGDRYNIINQNACVHVYCLHKSLHNYNAKLRFKQIVHSTRYNYYSNIQQHFYSA